jgi:hypothetical protein
MSRRNRTRNKRCKLLSSVVTEYFYFFNRFLQILVSDNPFRAYFCLQKLSSVSRPIWTWYCIISDVEKRPVNGWEMIAHESYLSLKSTTKYALLIRVSPFNLRISWLALKELSFMLSKFCTTNMPSKTRNVFKISVLVSVESAPRHQSQGQNHNSMTASKALKNAVNLKYLRITVTKNCIHEEIKSR